MYTINGSKLISNECRWAFKVVLLPMDDPRRSPDTVAAIGRWNLTLPGDCVSWSRYSLMAISLADFPGVPPAVKRFKDATHEVCLYAIDPRYDQIYFHDGGVQLLEPVNYLEHVIATDNIMNLLLDYLAELFVHRSLFGEPQGLTINGESARKAFRDYTYKFINEMFRQGIK